MDRRSPNYWQENLFSNHYIWSTPLNKENETRFEVKFSVPDFAFEVGGWQGVVSDKIYYGADSNVASMQEVSASRVCMLARISASADFIWTTGYCCSGVRIRKLYPFRF